MSSEQDHIRALARRIAERIERRDGSHDAPPSEDATTDALRAEVARLERRLAQLEKRNDAAVRSSVAARGGAETGDGGYERRDRTDATAMPARGETHGYDPPPAPRVLGGGGTYVSAVHPSQQRFGIDLAITELVDHFESGKRCDMEPGDKPCDNCGACSSRGF